MSLTKFEREQGYRELPRPPVWAEPILRRIAGGYLLLTQHEDGAYATYDNGKPIYMERTENKTKRHVQMNSDTVRQWVRRGWLIPIEGEALFEGGPAQRYRARTIEDGALPRIVDRYGKPYWTLQP